MAENPTTSGGSGGGDATEAKQDIIIAKTDNIPASPAPAGEYDSELNSITPDSGTHAHANNTDEQTMLTLVISEKTKINNILIDCTNLTQNTTIRTKVDGKTVDTLNFNTSMDDLQYLGTIVVPETVTVTIESGTAEGASRDMDWDVL